MEIKRVDRYWSGFFGLEVEDYLQPGIRVVPHAGLGEYHGIWVFRREGTGIVSAPLDWIEGLEEKVMGLEVEALHEEATIEQLGENAVERIVGPAWQGYVEREYFKPQPSEQVRELGAEDQPLLVRLAESGDARGWEDSGLGDRGGFVFGWRRGAQRGVPARDGPEQAGRLPNADGQCRGQAGGAAAGM